MKLPFPTHRLRRKVFPPGVFLCQSPEKLLHRHQEPFQEIRRMVGLPDRHYEALYQPLFLQHAAYCQELPASEPHHHCSPGGALRHCIEVALHAMKLHRKMLLPVGATAVELAATSGLPTAQRRRDACGLVHASGVTERATCGWLDTPKAAANPPPSPTRLTQ